MASILIIDDDDAFRTVLAKTLEAAGHVVAAVSDGFEGALCRTSPPALVMLDMIMPYGGLETIRVLHAQHPDIPIIAMSGSDPRRLDYALELGAVATVAKPFVVADLLALVDRTLAGGSHA